MDRQLIRSCPGCSDPLKKQFIKDAMCNRSTFAVVLYAILIIGSVASALVSIIAICKFCKRPPTSSKKFSVFLFVVFQLTYWSNVLFCLDIAFNYGSQVYFTFYFMTQIFYLSILAYLFTWVRILINTYEGTPTCCKVKVIRLITSFVFVLVALGFLVFFILAYYKNQAQKQADTPRHHPFHPSSAVLSALLLLSFLTVGTWMTVRFKRRFKETYRASLTRSVVSLVMVCGVCFLYPLVYESWSWMSPQYFYNLRWDNCNNRSVSWSLIQFFLYFTRTVPILLFHVFIIWRYNQQNRDAIKFRTNSTNSYIQMHNSELLMQNYYDSFRVRDSLACADQKNSLIKENNAHLYPSAYKVMDSESGISTARQHSQI